MKIGLLLGSFDPIHIGHISIASCVLNAKLCDKVLFVVAKHNPWKSESPAPFELRCQMVEASIRGFNGQCEVCRFEEEFEPPVYSYLPITKAIEAYPNDEISIVCGEDTLRKIPRWKNFETHIKDKVNFIEFSRGNTKSFEATENVLVESQRMFAKWITWDDKLGEHAYDKIQTQRIDMSSTIVRNMIAEGMHPFPYVNEEVCEIIKKYKLYK